MQVLVTKLFLSLITENVTHSVACSELASWEGILLWKCRNLCWKTMARFLFETVYCSRDPLENSSWCCLKVLQLCQWPVIKTGILELITDLNFARSSTNIKKVIVERWILKNSDFHASNAQKNHFDRKRRVYVTTREMDHIHHSFICSLR